MNSSLKKLRIQSILTMMTITTFFLVAIFSVQYLSSRREMIASSESTLRIALDEAQRNSWKKNSGFMKKPDNDFSDKYDSSKTDPDFKIPDENGPRMMDRFGNKANRRAVLLVEVTSDGNINPIRNDLFYMEDSYISEVVNATPYSEISENSDSLNPQIIKSYQLNDYNLRYSIKTDNNNTYIAYVDVADSVSTLSGLLKRSILISLGILIAMFILSLILSRRVLKPVEKAWNDQKRFIADASHELKTPLAVILSNTDMVLKSSDRNSEKNTRRIDNIKTESERMKELVQELLEVARGDLDDKENVFTDINLSELIEEELLTWDPVCYEAGKTLDSDIAENINIKGYATKLKRLVSILIDNAVKYSEEKSIIEVKLSSDSGTILKVSNKGTPLSKEECQKIFERFFRADESRESTPGYGLGLSIAESIVQEHGGSIEAVSNGTDTNTFVVRL